MPQDHRLPEVLQRDDIDAVMISTPDHWHTLMSVEAMRAGKDVQCEKPTLTIDEGKILVSEARRLKKVFQTSTEDRALPEYHRMAELVRNGRIGKLQKIEVTLPKQPTTPGDPTPQPTPDHLDYEMWLGPAPEAPYTKDRVHFHFRWIWDYQAASSATGARTSSIRLNGLIIPNSAAPSKSKALAPIGPEGSTIPSKNTTSLIATPTA